jgi:hypothetical protein
MRAKAELTMKSWPRRRAQKTSQPDEKGPRPSFSLGEQVLLTIRRGRHRCRALVTISENIWRVSLDRESVDGTRTVLISYKVRSAHGGELVVDPENLRSGNILDRISDAIEED